MTAPATTSAEALLLGEQTDGVARLTLNRPNQFKALSSALIAEMQVALDGIAADGIFGIRLFELFGFESLGQHVWLMFAGRRIIALCSAAAVLGHLEYEELLP